MIMISLNATSTIKSISSHHEVRIWTNKRSVTRLFSSNSNPWAHIKRRGKWNVASWQCCPRLVLTLERISNDCTSLNLRGKWKQTNLQRSILFPSLSSLAVPRRNRNWWECSLSLRNRSTKCNIVCKSAMTSSRMNDTEGLFGLATRGKNSCSLAVNRFFKNDLLDGINSRHEGMYMNKQIE